MRVKLLLAGLVSTAVLLAALLLAAPAPPLTAANGAAVYLPIVSRPVEVDLALTGLEVTQSIQTPANGVPLVAGRTTLARVYVTAVAGNVTTPFRVSLSAARGGANLGALYTTPRVLSGPSTRGALNSTFNFTLPTAWTTGDVTLTAMVDPDNAVAEMSKSNNQTTRVLPFNEVPPLRITIVPVDYTHTPTGQFYRGQAADPISEWMRRAFPVPDVLISYHTPHFFSGDLRYGSEWERLLREITERYWLPEQGYGSPQIYYALVPIRNAGGRWFSSGIAGIGWIGTRVSVGLDLGATVDTATLAAHEVGHNLGRRHAPCGNPAGVDRNYPYPDGSIGHYGVDVIDMRLYAPQTTWDLMSYCDPQWVSDYTYRGLYEDQRVHGRLLATARGDGLLVRAAFGPDGAPHLLPVYPLAQLPLGPPPAPGDFRLELLDAAGNVIAAHPARVLEAEEPGVRARALAVSAPLPETAPVALRLVDAQGQIVAEQALEGPARTQATAVALSRRPDGLITLAWDAPQTPALVRYSADGGATWTTLGMDVLGGSFSVEAARLGGKNGRFELTLANTNRPTRLIVALEE